MSMRLAGQVWATCNLDKTGTLILMALCDSATDTGPTTGIHCYASVAYFCWKTGASEATVYRCLEVFEECGILTPDGQGGYSIDLGQCPRKPDWQDVAPARPGRPRKNSSHHEGSFENPSHHEGGLDENSSHGEKNSSHGEKNSSHGEKNSSHGENSATPRVKARGRSQSLPEATGLRAEHSYGTVLMNSLNERTSRVRARDDDPIHYENDEEAEADADPSPLPPLPPLSKDEARAFFAAWDKSAATPGTSPHFARWPWTEEGDAYLAAAGALAWTEDEWERRALAVYSTWCADKGAECHV